MSTAAVALAEPFDVVVYGATSFVGQIICRHLVASRTTLRWAMAGRSQKKLESVRAALGAGAGGVPLVIASADDDAALELMCRQARVVLSTVGPYALYGEPLVRVCARVGTDYVDLTGETPFVRKMIDSYRDDAERTGARIVHCCGFDSVPSDMGVFFLENEAMARFGAPCVDVKMRVKATRGGASGGTIATMLNIAREASHDAALRRLLADPYALCPPVPPSVTRVQQRDVTGPVRDDDFGAAWLAPFVMAAINTRVVLRSHALRGQPFGADFRYDEAMLMGRGPAGAARAWALTAGIGGALVGAALSPTRALLGKVLPGPGEGPSEDAQENGFFDVRFVGRTGDGRVLRTQVTGDRDPGYGSTAKMITEAAACLALDVKKSEVAGGFWTPATALGAPFLARLRAHAGLAFNVVDDEAASRPSAV